MPRELVCLQVGQCGNQVGCKFWDLALQEHLKYKGDGTVRKVGEEKRVKMDDAMSSFFRSDPRNVSDDGTVAIQNIKARAVPIDMEEGVLESLLQGNLKTLFDKRHCIAGDTSGCGNNWAVGHIVYGQQCLGDVMEKIRHTTEDCDSLQTFLMLHSLGGGTGSGFGTRVLQELADEYPCIYRFVSPVFPQENDDVVTSPYNSVLSLGQLIDHADCVLPVDNQQLAEIAALSQSPQRNKKEPSYQISQPGHVKSSQSSDRKGGEAFASMNYIVASMLTNLTASMRFPGQLNVDLNELTTNLVPFPSLKFIYSSVAPIALSKHSCHSASRRVDELFRDAFSRKCQLLTAPEFKPTYFASCMLLRGDVSLSDATSNVEKLRRSLNLAPWNTEGFKVGLCSVPACESPVSLLSLTNNSGITQSLSNIQDRFAKLYNVHAHLHHYTEYIEQEEIHEAFQKTSSLIDSYEQAAAITIPDGMRQSSGKLIF